MRPLLALASIVILDFGTRRIALYHRWLSYVEMVLIVLRDAITTYLLCSTVKHGATNPRTLRGRTRHLSLRMDSSVIWENTQICGRNRARIVSANAFFKTRGDSPDAICRRGGQLCSPSGRPVAMPGPAMATDVRCHETTQSSVFRSLSPLISDTRVQNERTR
jgi:hypothetical protein